MNKKETKSLKKEPIGNLMAQLEVEKDDDTWIELYDEIMERSPFQGIAELIDNSDIRIDGLEKKVKELSDLLTKHQHLDGKTVVTI
jgi:hypothetical protein